MKISDQIKLSLFTSVSDDRYERLPYCYFFEREANKLLSDAYYWLNRKVIIIGGTTPYVTENFIANVAGYHNHHWGFSVPNSAIDKIKRIAKLIFAVLPAITLKILFWMFHPNYVRQRNQLIIDELEKQENFKKQSELTHIIHPKEFDQALNQSNCLHQTPEVLRNQIFSFLTDQELAMTARSSKQTYAMIAQHSSTINYLSRDFPKVIVDALGKSRLAQLPFSNLCEGWYTSFEQAKNWDTYIAKKIDKLKLLIKILASEKIDPSFITRFYPTDFKDDPIVKIQVGDISGIAIQIKNNIKNNLQIFLILQIGDKWVILTEHLPPAMWLFLNDISFDAENCPKVEDYLNRLFHGEPCGEFPWSLNHQIPLDYCNEQAADILQEGERCIAGSNTSVVELWPRAVRSA